MNIIFSKNFEKQYKKIRLGEKDRFNNRLITFQEESFHPILNNHALQGKFQGYRSINITGDIRAVYKMLSKSTAMFVDIGSHSELYS